jgi:hypothetical protein
MSLGKRIFRMIRSQTQGLRDQWRSGPNSESDPGGQGSENNAYTGDQNREADGGDQREKEYLANLELESFVSYKEVQRAHRRLLKKYHPDLHASDPEKRKYAEQITIRLNEALSYFETKEDKGAG